MSNKYELIRSKETGCPICIFDNENQVRVCTFNSSNAAIESEAVKVLDGLNESADLERQLAQSEERVKQYREALERAVQSIEYLGGKGNGVWQHAKDTLLPK